MTKHHELSEDMERFGQDFLIEQILGQRTLWVLSAPEQVNSYIVRPDSQSRPCGLEDYIVLADGPNLSAEQVHQVRDWVLNSRAHYSGRPRFRRFPHLPNFALCWVREDIFLDLLLDLYNPGWDFCCGDEHYSNWHWVDFTALAKSLFPEYASPSSKSIWRQDAIVSLGIKRR
jgi:hypothetical protein